VAVFLEGGPPWPVVGPGLGLTNVLIYRGASDGNTALAVTLLLLALAGGALVLGGMRPLGFASLAAAVLVAAWLLPSVPAHAVGVPLALMALAVANPLPSRERD
jgi:hypothetical protein